MTILRLASVAQFKLWSFQTRFYSEFVAVADWSTLRRKNTDTFASVCSKMAIFKRPENYPKDMQNSLSFHQLIDHIGEASE